jgi:hypothetical protein
MSSDNSPNPYMPREYAVETESIQGPLQGYSKIACIFFIILGSIGILMTMQAVLGMAISMAGAANGGAAFVSPFTGALALSVLIALVNFIVSVGEIVGGVQGLQQKRFGANLIRGISGFMLVFKIIETTFGAVFTFMSIDSIVEQAKKNMDSQPNAPPFDMGQVMPIIFYAVIGVSIAMGVAMFLFYLFTFLHFSKQKTLSQFS